MRFSLMHIIVGILTVAQASGAIPAPITTCPPCPPLHTAPLSRAVERRAPAVGCICPL